MSGEDKVGTWNSPRAKRVLDATRTLLLRGGSRGVTIADVAKMAQVGKGTVYLYWDSKEELIVELFIHDFLTTIDEVQRNLAATAANAVPSALLPLMHRTVRKHPFLSALQTRDYELFGYVDDHPSIRTLMDRLGPGALLAQILPELRVHGLARADVPLETQIYGAMALLEGFMQLPHAYPYRIDLGGEAIDADAAMADVSRLLLEPQSLPDMPRIAAAATAVQARIAASRDAAVQSLPVGKGARKPRVAEPA